MPSCGTAEIWSHRAHLDAYSRDESQLECADVLRELSQHGVSHFDIDIVYHGDIAVVAHPMEMTDDSGSASLARSPCSRLAMSSFVDLLKKYYVSEQHGEDEHNALGYVNIEPKSAWKNDTASSFLAPPQHVLGGLLDILESDAGKSVLSGRCGVTLYPSELEDSRVSPLQSRLQKHCDLVLPTKLVQGPLLHSDVEELSKLYNVSLPTVELFGGLSGKLFLQETTKFHVRVILWTIDTLDDVRKALRLDKVHGIISNQPLKMQKAMNRMCS